MVQQKEDGATLNRARYYSGLMDMNTLEPGRDYEELRENYMIFLTEDDVLGHGLPIYHIDRNIGEVSEEFPDEALIIYINTSIQEDTELGRLSQMGLQIEQIAQAVKVSVSQTREWIEEAY